MKNECGGGITELFHNLRVLGHIGMKGCAVKGGRGTPQLGGEVIVREILKCYSARGRGPLPTISAGASDRVARPCRLAWSRLTGQSLIAPHLG